MNWSKLILVSLASCSLCFSSSFAEAEAGYGYRSYGHGGLSRSYKNPGHRAKYTNGQNSHNSYITRQKGYKLAGGVENYGVGLKKVLGRKGAKSASVIRDTRKGTSTPIQQVTVKQIRRPNLQTKVREAVTPKQMPNLKQITQVQLVTERRTPVTEKNTDIRQTMRQNPTKIVRNSVAVVARTPIPPQLPMITTPTTIIPSTQSPPTLAPSLPPSPPAPPATSPIFPLIPAVPGKPVISESASVTSNSNFELRPVPAVPGLLPISDQPV